MKSKKVVATLIIASVGMTGCATTGDWGSKQTAGTLLGTIGGALIGGQIGGGSGRTVAIIAGALAGGALGNWIGSNLDKKDQEALALSTQQALESGRTVAWASDHSGATATITPVSSKQVSQTATVKRSARIARVDNLSVINQPYEALRSANLRAAPNTSAEKVGGFAVGQSFSALGRTDNNWIAVGRQGVTIGYVHAPLVAPVKKHKEDHATDLDTLTVADAQTQGFDLDAIQPAAPVVENVAVQTTCRTVQYDIKTTKGSDSKTVDACQGADGAWQIG
ncbi:MAG: SH3 domain-containing protein [Alcaligenaceae bacterium]|nr:SH3 domain-containing protein [Alcaligenaceae bacterium]